VKEEVQVGEEEEEEEKEREDLTSINRPLLPYYSCKTQHILTTYCNVGRDSSVCTAARYGLGGPGIESRWRRGFPHPPAPCTMGTGSFTGIKRPGLGVNHTHTI